MSITATYSAQTGKLTIVGDDIDNNIVSSRNAAGAILVNGGAVAISGDTPTLANTNLIKISGQGGNDTIVLDESSGALPVAHLYGGVGNDILTGGSGGDQLFGEGGDDTLLAKGGSDFLYGGAGDDTLTGGDANDQVFGQDGNDRMTWNPGDDSDLFDGGAGIDTLAFTASNLDENIDISANGGRARLFRDVANVTIDLNEVEKIALSALGGEDFITVNDLAGTAVQSVAIDLASGGVADGAKDAVLVNGTGGADQITLVRSGLQILVNGLPAQVAISGHDAGVDGLQVDASDGSDTIDAGALGAGDMRLVLKGGNGDDLIVGGNGADILFGGAGNNTFKFNAPSSNADLIVDFHKGDHILLGSGFVSEGGGSHPLGNSVHFQYGTAATGVGPTILYNGFNGVVAWDADGNGSGGAVTFAQVQFDEPSTSFSSLPRINGYSVLGTGDFNGDGTSDVVLRSNSTGATEIWFMNDGHIIGDYSIGNTAGYTMAATGDFNHDGTGDILWKNNASGQVETWLMKDGHYSSGSVLGNLTGYAAVGTGDFNHDGNIDIVWQHSSGSTDIWFIGGGRVVGDYGQGNLAGYNLIGTGDLNGDGTSDLMWQNKTSGVAENWLMKDGHYAGGFTFGNLSGYQLLETADLNHDGTADLLWFNKTNGELSDWIMQDGHFSGESQIYGAKAVSYQGIGAGDFSHDGGGDALIRDPGTNALEIWDFDHHLLTASDFLIA